MAREERRLRAYYKSLDPVYCSALNEIVHFGPKGLHHLLYKSGDSLRSRRERLHKLRLLPLAHAVIRESQEAVKRVKSAEPLVITWALHAYIDTQHVRVIVIRRGRGRLEFLSIMQIAKEPR